MNFYLKLNDYLSLTYGMLITLFIGTAWLRFSANLLWASAFTGGFTPFIIVGLMKAGLASWIGILIRQRLIAARLLNFNPSEVSKTA